MRRSTSRGEIVNGVQVGEFRQVSTAAENALEAGLSRSGPSTEDYLFAVDEVFLVLEGSVRLTCPTPEKPCP